MSKNKKISYDEIMKHKPNALLEFIKKEEKEEEGADDKNEQEEDKQKRKNNA